MVFPSRFAPDESETHIYMHNVLVEFAKIRDFFTDKGLPMLDCTESDTGKSEIITTLRTHRVDFLLFLKKQGVRTTHTILNDDEIESIAGGICQFVNYHQIQNLGGSRRRHLKKTQRRRRRKSYKKKSNRRNKRRN